MCRARRKSVAADEGGATQSAQPDRRSWAALKHYGTTAPASPVLASEMATSAAVAPPSAAAGQGGPGKLVRHQNRGKRDAEARRLPLERRIPASGQPKVSQLASEWRHKRLRDSDPPATDIARRCSSPRSSRVALARASATRHVRRDNIPALGRAARPTTTPPLKPSSRRARRHVSSAAFRLHAGMPNGRMAARLPRSNPRRKMSASPH